MARPSTPKPTTQTVDALRLPAQTATERASGSAFSLSEMALPQDFDAAIGLETRVHTVPVKKPGKLAFFRVHPAPEFRMAIAILRDDLGEMYAVHPKALANLADEAKPMMLYTIVDEVGNVSLWPVGLPGSDGRTNAWWQSGHAAASQGQSEWVRLVPAMDAGFYKVKTSKVDKGEPRWPELSFEELLLRGTPSAVPKVRWPDASDCLHHRWRTDQEDSRSHRGRLRSPAHLPGAGATAVG